MALFAIPLLLAVGATVHPASPAAADPISNEQQFLELINELRASQGLPTLTRDPELEAESRVWAEFLRAQDGLSHAPDLSVGVSSYWVKLGENVGVGPENQVQALFDAFVASPDHYANLIDPSFTYAGIGVVYGNDGRIWTTHRFMAVADQPAPATTATTAPTATAPATNPVATTAPPATTPAPTTTAPAQTTTTAAPEPIDPAAPIAVDAPLDRNAVASLLLELSNA